MVGTWSWRLLACVTEVYTLLNVCMSDNRKLVDRLGDYVNSLWVKRGRSKVSGLSTYCLLSLAPVVFGYVACESSQIPVVASFGGLLRCLVLGRQMTVRLSPHLSVCGDRVG